MDQRLCVLLAVVSSVAGLSRAEDSILPKELKMVLDNCMARPSPGHCLQKKMLDFLERALAKDTIPLADGFQLTKSKNANYTAEPSARQSGSGAGTIEDMIWKKLDTFFKTRVLSISLAEEGRGKKKKEHAYYAVAVGTALALLIPLTLKGLALLAGKALLVAKLALLLAGLAALKHFFHHQHHGGEGDTHRRVHIDDLAEAHNLAYSGYSPQHHHVL